MTEPTDEGGDQQRGDTILRVEVNRNYKTLPLYAVADDESLSWKAKGLHTYLLSRPDDWRFWVSEVRQHASDGKTSLQSGLRELEDAGYLKRERVRRENGTLGGYVWTVSEIPKRSWAAEGRDIPPERVIRGGLSATDDPRRINRDGKPAPTNKDVSSQDGTKKDVTTDSDGGDESGDSDSGESEDLVRALTEEQREEATDVVTRFAWLGKSEGYDGCDVDQALAQVAGIVNSGYSFDRVMLGVKGVAKMRADGHERLQGWIEPGDPFNPTVLTSDRISGEKLIEVGASYALERGAHDLLPPHEVEPGSEAKDDSPRRWECPDCTGVKTVQDRCPNCDRERAA